jgi:serine/threonine-protein kinase RsbW
MVVWPPVTAPAVISVTYPGTPASVAAARRCVRQRLGPCPRVDDLELIASELATNAIRHTRSGQPGGTFTMTVCQQRGAVYLAVTDLGARRWRGRGRTGGPLATGGRGLLIVTALADQAGQRRGRGRRQVSWARLTW